VMDDGHYALIDGYVSYASDRLWTEFYAVPIVRSLLTMQGRWNFPADPASDRKSLPAAIKGLNLSAVVIFDSPEKANAIEYLEKVTGEQGIASGSCTVFDMAAIQPAPRN
jgi:hypothetical protein